MRGGSRLDGRQGRDAIDTQPWSPAGPATVFESAAHAVCLPPMTD
ncbi:hypothetical protein AB0J71_48910 [Nonomuraea sp. NPDC049637]